MSDSISIRIDPSELRNVRIEDGGIKVITSPSPYDIPDAMVLDFDRSKKQILLNFKYLSNEPVQLINEDGITFGLGRTTRRLYEVKVDVGQIAARAADAASRIVNLIDRKIDELGKKSQNDSSDSYIVAERAVSMEKDELTLKFNNFLSQI